MTKPGTHTSYALPPGYSMGTWRGGHTFTWREGQTWHQATEEMGQPWPTPEAAHAALVAHARARGLVT